ncbi:nitroreductase [Nakamurella sp. UYEF19]|uniref:Acg family FMN-binding oxidoreductase n=1 Tax=Nakamurella sp. UYEF19 TaxID=1756392 RepID=UPI00339B962E
MSVIITPFGLSAEQTDLVLTAGCRAPSLHNSQPWAFVLAPDRIELHLDPDRALTATDPDGREARIACGAVLFNLKLALARYGIAGRVTLDPDQGRGPLAVIDHAGDGMLSPERAELERAITHRRTNRQPFFDLAVSVGYQRTLIRAAEIERTHLQIISDGTQLSQLHRWAAAAHRHQLADPAWSAEWAAWTGRNDSVDGVPIWATGPARYSPASWNFRDFGRPQSAPGSPAHEDPLIAVLSTYTDQPQAQIQAGQAMQRVLLTATNIGLAASFVSQLIEVEPVRRDLADLIGGHIHPQVVLRLGFGGPVASTPRRSAQDCLVPSVANHAPAIVTEGAS